jgi:hypothetical protein
MVPSRSPGQWPGRFCPGRRPGRDGSSTQAGSPSLPDSGKIAAVVSGSPRLWGSCCSSVAPSPARPSASPARRLRACAFRRFRFSRSRAASRSVRSGLLGMATSGTSIGGRMVEAGSAFVNRPDDPTARSPECPPRQTGAGALVRSGSRRLLLALRSSVPLAVVAGAVVAATLPRVVLVVVIGVVAVTTVVIGRGADGAARIRAARLLAT